MPFIFILIFLFCNLLGFPDQSSDNNKCVKSFSSKKKEAGSINLFEAPVFIENLEDCEGESDFQVKNLPSLFLNDVFKWNSSISFEFDKKLYGLIRRNINLLLLYQKLII
jgi:hypothetical protein